MFCMSKFQIFFTHAMTKFLRWQQCFFLLYFLLGWHRWFDRLFRLLSPL